MKTKTRLLVIDRNPLMRSGLRHILQSGAYFDVLEAKDDTAALAALELVEINLVLHNITVDNLENDKALIKNIKSKYPLIKLIVLSAHSDFKLVYDLYAAGAAGMLDKKDEGKILIKNIKLILKDSYSFDETLRKFIMKKSLQDNSPIDLYKLTLSKRQLEIATLWCDWKTVAQISAELSIKTNTVNSHLRKIYKKTAMHSRVQLLEFMRAYK